MPDLTLAGLTRQALRISGKTYSRKYPEAASQSFVAGDFVTVNSSGQVAIAATAGNALASTGDRLIGVANEAASGTTNNYVEIEVFTEDTRFTLPVYHATPASAVTAETTVDSECVLHNETTGGWVADIGTTSNPVLHCVGQCNSYDGNKLTIGGQYNPMRWKVIGLERVDQ